MLNFFEPIQEDILTFKEKFEKEFIVFDKTNQMFLDINLNLLEYVATEDPTKLETLCEYSIRTMGKEFKKVIEGNIKGEKAQAVLLMFFLRIANEKKVRKESIENPDLNRLYEIMTSPGYKYPEYIRSQKNFALEILPEKVKRMERLK